MKCTKQGDKYKAEIDAKMSEIDLLKKQHQDELNRVAQDHESDMAKAKDDIKNKQGELKECEAKYAKKNEELQTSQRRYEDELKQKELAVQRAKDLGEQVAKANEDLRKLDCELKDLNKAKLLLGDTKNQLESRLAVSQGTQLAEQGRLDEALLLFSEALRLVKGDDSRVKQACFRILTYLRFQRDLKSREAQEWYLAFGLPASGTTTDAQLQRLELSPDGSCMAMQHNSGVDFWKYDSEKKHYVSLLENLKDKGKDRALGAISNPLKNQPKIRYIAAIFRNKVEVWRIDFLENGTAKNPYTIISHDENDPVLSVAFNQDASLIVTTSRNTVRVSQCINGARIDNDIAHPSARPKANFLPDGQSLFTYGTQTNDYLEFWVYNKGKEPAKKLSFKALSEKIAISITQKKCCVAFVNEVGDLAIWDVLTDNCLQRIPIAAWTDLEQLLFSPSGNLLAVVGKDLVQTRVWDVTSGKPLTPPITGLGYKGSVVFSRDEQRLAIWDGKSVRIFDSISGEPLSPALPHSNVTHAIFDHDCKSLTTFSSDKSVKYWEFVPPLNAEPTMQLTSWITGYELDSTNGLVPLSPKAISSLRTELFRATVPGILPQRLAQSPLTEQEAEDVQLAWAQFIGASKTDFEVEIKDGKKMSMVLIPPGMYTMGSPGPPIFEQGRTEHPFWEHPHRVAVLDPFKRGKIEPFCIGKFEVTQQQFAQLMPGHQSKFNDPKLSLPVESLSWAQAVEFTEKLNELEKQKYGENALQFRLPTEAEWEYASRAGSQAAFSPNGENLGDYAWYKDNSQGKTHLVGEKKANPWGLHDMYGNVREWCRDVFDENFYRNRPDPDIDPFYHVENNKVRTTRGGAWNDDWKSCRSAYRASGMEGTAIEKGYIGFRVVCSVPTRARLNINLRREGTPPNGSVP